MNHAKSIVIAAALLAAGAAFGATPPEGSYPEQPMASADRGRPAPKLPPKRFATT